MPDIDSVIVSNASASEKAMSVIDVPTASDSDMVKAFGVVANDGTVAIVG